MSSLAAQRLIFTEGEGLVVSWLRIRQGWFWVLALALALPLGAQPESRCSRVGGYDFETGTELVPTGEPGHWSERRYFRVRRGRKLLFERRGQTCWIIDMKHPNEDNSPYPPPGFKPRLLDFTGDGFPEVVVESWNGGAHGAYQYDVFTVAPAFRRLWHVNAVYGHLDFRQTRPLPEIILEDTTFAYWNCGYADAPRMKVIYRWNGKAFALVVDKMRIPLNRSDYQRRLDHVLGRLAAERASFQPNLQADLYDRWGTGPALTLALLELIYGGHADQAWRLLADVWPRGEQAAMQRFKSDFLTQLKKSPHLAGLKALNPPGTVTGGTEAAKENLPR